MIGSPLPPGANGNDAAEIVFQGCTVTPQKRATLGLALGAYAVSNGIAAGGVGIIVGFGVTWFLARKLRQKKVI